jgi:hypothetical protein
VEGLAVDLRESRRPVVADADLRRGQHFGQLARGVAQPDDGRGARRTAAVVAKEV